MLLVTEQVGRGEERIWRRIEIKKRKDFGESGREKVERRKIRFWRKREIKMGKKEEFKKEKEERSW